MKKVLVTGASGFVGRHLVERLCSDGHQVVGTYRSRRPDWEGAGRVVWEPWGGALLASVWLIVFAIQRW